MKALLLVFLGGGFGSVARYALSKTLNATPPSFALGTLTVNIIGSLIIGIVLGLALKHQAPSNNLVLFIATGFCGGFTTFSAFSYENVMLLKSVDYQTFIIYTITSIALGLVAVFAGIYVAKFF